MSYVLMCVQAKTTCECIIAEGYKVSYSVLKLRFQLSLQGILTVYSESTNLQVSVFY